MKKLTLPLVLIILLLVGCENSKVASNLEYVQLVETRIGDILQFIDSEGRKRNYIVDSKDYYDLQVGSKYNVEVSVETWYQYEGYIENVEKLN
jgi:uncharacterized lipoprotein NlpE involved in copper resistance